MYKQGKHKTMMVLNKIHLQMKPVGAILQPGQARSNNILVELDS